MVDHAHGYAYFTFSIWSYADHQSIQGVVAKVKIPDLILAGTMNLTGAGSGVIDSTSSYAYFSGENATNSSPLVYKVQLSDFTLIRTLPISDRSPRPFGPPLIDDSNLYYGPSKISLSSFSYVSSLQLTDPSIFPGNSLGPGYGCSPCYELDPVTPVAVIDPASGYSYLGGDRFSGGTRAMVVKVSLSDFRPVAKLILPGTGVNSAVIDTIHGYAYFTEYGTVTQIRLSDFTIVTVVEFCGYGNSATGPDNQNGGSDLSLIDPESGYAYYYTAYLSPRIYKIDFSAPAPDSCTPSPIPPIWNILQNAWNLRLPIPYWPLSVLQTAGLGSAVSVASVGLSKFRNKRKGKSVSSSKKPQSLS